MIPVRVETTYTQPPELSARRWREFMRTAHREMGQYWHRRFLRGHFRRGAATRYGYQPRTRNYQRKKARAFARGEAVKRNTDLVFTGLLKRTMEQASTVRGFPTRATVRMTGPRYITMRPFKSNQPDKAAEITKVTPDEADTLAAVLDTSITRAMQNWHEPRTVKD